MPGLTAELNARAGLELEIEAVEHIRATLVRALLACNPRDEYYQADLKRLRAEIKEKEEQLTELRETWAKATEREAAEQGG